MEEKKFCKYCARDSYYKIVIKGASDFSGSSNNNTTIGMNYGYYSCIKHLDDVVRNSAHSTFSSVDILHNGEKVGSGRGNHIEVSKKPTLIDRIKNIMSCPLPLTSDN